MKKLNFLSKVCGLARASQYCDVGIDRRLTVGSPSGSHRLTKYIAVMFLLLVVGVGNVWSSVTFQSYEDNVLDESATISSSNVSIGSAGEISWSGNSCSYSDNRLNISANGYITFTASEGNNITKIVIYSASTGYYGTWTSNPSGTVTTSSGTTTITGLNANSVRITTSSAFRATSGANTYIKIYYTEAFDGCDIFHETFNSCNKNGGNDDTWSGISTTGTIAVDNAGWTFVQGNAASKCARFGTGSYKGSAETPAIAYTGSKNLILTFKAGAWNGGSEQTTLNLSATNATLDKSSVTMTKGEWDEFTVTLSSVSNNFKVKWEGKQASNSRFFLDEICIEEETGSTKTLSSLAITTDPTTKKYLVGDTFNKTGAVVTATYSDATTADVSASTSWTPTTGLTSGSNTITASYTEGGVTETATTTVTAYTVTVNKVDEDGTAIADAGVTASCTGRTLSQSVGSTNYVFKEWQLTTASGTSISTNSITGTPTGNVVVNAVFYKPRVIEWKVNNVAYTPGSPGSATVKYNSEWSELTLPTDPDVGDYCGQIFVGWTTTDMGESSYDKTADAAAISALVLMTNDNKSDITTKIIEATRTFHAVFADYDE